MVMVSASFVLGAPTAGGTVMGRGSYSKEGKSAEGRNRTGDTMIFSHGFFRRSHRLNRRSARSRRRSQRL